MNKKNKKMVYQNENIFRHNEHCLKTKKSNYLLYPKTQAPFTFVFESHFILEVNSRIIDDLMESSYCQIEKYC